MRKPIIDYFPKHQTYVEVFGGAGHILFAKDKSNIEIYNDINDGLINFFKVLREQPNKLYQKLKCTPYSRKEFEICCEEWKNEKEELEKARKWFVALIQSFSCKFAGSWSYDKTAKRAISRWMSNLNKIKSAAERFRTVQIENLSFEKLIPKYDTENTLFYLDPPYVPDTRVSKKVYEKEMTVEQHELLVELLLEIEGKAVLSGYKNDIYKKLLDNGWELRKIGDYEKSTAKATEKGKRNYGEEYIWINFEEKKQKQPKLF